ncbi:MAG TPA: hypothetical protein DCK93_21775 [Blastocatellia bacterium]|jgi:hypothetical protein|nr:hypothetical protein [Blastocatellia bacterium]
MSNESWYSAQCIFLHADTGQGPKQMYEERVVLLRADSVDAAIERAEREAEEYCRDLDGCKYVGDVNVFDIYDGKPGDGAGCGPKSKVQASRKLGMPTNVTALMIKKSV